MSNETTLVHKWELAGLGKAPYRCVGNTREVYRACQGAPVQPGTCCDYCGQGIMDTYWIVSVDGQRFKVGVSCVRRVSHKGDRVLSEVEKRHRKSARKRTHQRQDAVIASGIAALLRCEVRKELRSQPHPNGFVNRSTGKPMTALDQVVWLLRNGGRAGKVRGAKRAIEAVNA